MTPVLTAILQRGAAAAAPSSGVVYKTTLTDTANADLSTFTAVDIGTPHPRRLVILSIYRGVGVSGTVTATVNGISQRFEENTGNASQQCSILVFRVPLGLTADIAVSATGSQRKAVAVSIFYPKTPFYLGGDHIQATTTTDAVVTVPTTANGAVFYAGAQPATLGAFGVTSSGADAVIEDVDAQLEATSSYTMGHIDVTLGSDITLTLAETVSGTKYLTVLSLGVAA